MFAYILWCKMPACDEDDNIILDYQTDYETFSTHQQALRYLNDEVPKLGNGFYHSWYIARRVVCRRYFSEDDYWDLGWHDFVF